MNKSLFSLNWFVYFFTGFMVLALAVAVTGVNITFWREYTLLPQTPLETEGLWYTINRFDNNFWSTFRTLNNYYQYLTFDIPSIPYIPTFDTNINGWLVVVNVLIYLTNGLFTIVNLIGSVVNSVRTIVMSFSAFINTLVVWISNAGSYIIVRS